MAFSALFLIAASWMPVLEIRGFDTFGLNTIALWATRGARFALLACLLCLTMRSPAASRWWMALAVGMLSAPLMDMAVRSIDLMEMMGENGPTVDEGLIRPLAGSWLLVIGLMLWLADLYLALRATVARSG